MRIILLGASGQVGSEIYKELKNNSANEVIGTSRNSSKGLFKFDPFKDDWSALGKADVLINSVGIIQETKELSFDKVHRQLTLLIIKNRALLGNPRIIQISVLGASIDSPADFTKTKGIADEYLIQFPDTVVVRPSIVCTHKTVFVNKMLMLLNIAKFSGGLIFVPNGFVDHKIQPVMPEDLALIVSNLLDIKDSPKIIYAVGPDEISHRQMVGLLFKLRKKRFKFIGIPRVITDSLIKWIISPFFPGIINEQQYRLLFADNIADKKNAEKYLGRPMTSTVDFWKKEFE